MIFNPPIFERELEMAQVEDRLHWTQNLSPTFHCAACGRLVYDLYLPEQLHYLCNDCCKKWNVVE